MNVCFVCNEYPDGPHGGVGTVTQLLAEEMVIRRNSVKVIGVYDLTYPSPKFEVRNGVEITRIKVNHRNKISVFWGNWLLSVIIRKLIRKGLVDIIESPDSYGLFSIFAAFKVPLVLRAHGNNTYFCSVLKTPLKKKTAFYERNLYRKAYGFCAVSEFTANRMKSLLNIRASITVIHNGIELQKERALEGLQQDCGDISEYINPIIFSGTLTRKKGIYELVKAVILLLNKGIELTLVINGKDSVNSNSGKSVKNELMYLIPRDLAKNFVFNGHVTRSVLLCQYKTAKAAIFPSYAEAFAMAPMEAMAAGSPTVFSRECSGAELINDKEDGLLVNPFSDISIAQAIEDLLKNPERAAQIGKKGKEKIEKHFSKELMAIKTLEFYEQIRTDFSGKR